MLRAGQLRIADDRYRPALAMVVACPARRSKAFPDGARCNREGGADLVRRAGLCRGRDRHPPGIAGQRDASACPSHRADRRRRHPGEPGQILQWHRIGDPVLLQPGVERDVDRAAWFLPRDAVGARVFLKAATRGGSSCGASPQPAGGSPRPFVSTNRVSTASARRPGVARQRSERPIGGCMWAAPIASSPIRA